MITTSDLNFAAVLIALGLGRLSKAIPPQDGGRLITFELTVRDFDMERARGLEQGYNEIVLTDPDSPGGPRVTLGDYLDGIQRARKAMRLVQVSR